MGKETMEYKCGGCGAVFCIDLAQFTSRQKRSKSKKIYCSRECTALGKHPRRKKVTIGREPYPPLSIDPWARYGSMYDDF